MIRQGDRFDGDHDHKDHRRIDTQNTLTVVFQERNIFLKGVCTEETADHKEDDNAKIAALDLMGKHMIE